MRPALEGFRVERFEAPRLIGAHPVAGTLITGVEARGKFLLVHFGEPGPPRTLETHMKMTGSWHLYRHGERWRRSARSVRVRIDADSGWTAVCFSAPHVRILGPGGARSAHDHLGPDLTGPSPDLDEAVARFARFGDPDREIGPAMLDQRICCGVGNVYKSEVLHAERLDPRTPVADIDLPTRRRLVETAHRLLRANLSSGARITTTDTAKGLAVYRRADEACPRCGGAIERIVQGEHARSTYHCPRCQLRPGEATAIAQSPGARSSLDPGLTSPDS